ncbi:hypothetical protein KDA23_07485 [Candidatus Saccharibacteria bacterium]|nr:hypothetical protein [Candidatus Saccharibacteria bacterium]
MLVLEFVKWWYGRGWAGALGNVKGRAEALSEMFSVSILLRTLFSPWRRIITYPGAGLDAHLRAFVDNLVSRFIGFLVRVTVLVTAGVVFGFMIIASAIELIAWPLVPVAGIGLIVWGIL